jgi:lipopolysaccharide/colanic/teichoic acid biosynthesis glycosyltransferase
MINPFYRDIFKPVVDFISALILLILLSPVIFVSILALLIANRGKIFFLQERPGLKTRKFKIIKFKTMRDAFDSSGAPLPDEMRLTRIGKVIRAASIDELLQLINVLKGEMSIVGPRPLLVQYLAYYSEKQARRHDVKPGITGWAQVNGRNSISWEEKFRLDVEYVSRQSIWLDLRILWMSVIYVIRRKGINAEGQATIQEFRGSVNDLM